MTGSGNPLGREFVNTLNEKAFNVILVDGDEAALQKQADELRNKSLYPEAKVVTIKFDMKQADQWQ